MYIKYQFVHFSEGKEKKMSLRKNTTSVFALSLALSTVIGGGIASASEMTAEDYPWDHPYPTAEERDVENIHPTDTDTKDSWKWGEWLHCEDVMDKDFQDKLKEVGDINTTIYNGTSPGEGDGYEHPTEEELNNLEESSWDAPGDYAYLVEKYPDDKKPKLMKVKGKDKYFIATNVAKEDRDPEIEEKYFYRLFKPENYLSKDMVEWKVDPKNGKKYNAKLYDGYGFTFGEGMKGEAYEGYSPYGEEFIQRLKLKPELMPEKGLSLSERFDYFMKHDDVFSFNNFNEKSSFSKIRKDGTFMMPSREYIENPDTGEKELSHEYLAFATCGPQVFVKPDYVSTIAGEYVGGGAKDLRIRASDYLYPSDNGLTLRKTNKDNKLLAGSSWKIKNLGTKEEFTVTDNKKPGDNDKNALEDLYKEDGLINVALPEGRYELTESKAPEGYKVDSTPRKFVIHDRTGASFGMGAITNEPEKPDTPDTPDEPDTPDTPDKPDTPGTPDKPSKSESPSTSTTPRRDTSTPSTSKTPSTPSTSKTPSTPSTSKTPSTPVDDNAHNGDNDEGTPVEENNPSFAATTTPVSPIRDNSNSNDSFTPNSPSTPYQPKKVSGDTQPLNDSKAGPEVNTGGNITLSFWDKVKGIFS